MLIRRCIFSRYERPYLCIKQAKWQSKDAPGVMRDLTHTEVHHNETLEHLGGLGERLQRVLECLWREWTMRQIETEWHVPLN